MQFSDVKRLAKELNLPGKVSRSFGYRSKNSQSVNLTSVCPQTIKVRFHG